MPRTRHLATALLALLVPFGETAGTATDTTSTDTAPTDPQGDAIVEWAMARYRSAGLELPDDTSIVFHDTVEPCEGNQGTVRPERGNEIWVCATHEQPDVQHRLREHIVLHELAHVWAATHLDDGTRDEFLRFRGADNWNDRSADWWERGTEQAAEVITWGLLDRDPGFQRINDRACPTMLEGYRLLTGGDPINDSVECRPSIDAADGGDTV